MATSSAQNSCLSTAWVSQASFINKLSNSLLTLLLKSVKLFEQAFLKYDLKFSIITPSSKGPFIDGFILELHVELATL